MASAPDLDAARRVAMMLLSGTRTADLSAQERSAEDEARSREASREASRKRGEGGTRGA